MGAKEYEELVADVCTRLIKAGKAKVHRDQRLVGRSGQEHQVDVVVELEFLAIKILILVECKWWNQRVGIEQVMVLAGRLDDIGAHKGIIVTTAGFQSGAYRLARSKGIALVLCKDRLDPGCDALFITDLPSYGRGGEPPRYSYCTVQADGVTEYESLFMLLCELAKEGEATGLP